ncbi:MAG: quinone-dependent dihydroorotate dehydrogenase [Candidatus Dojkabacteria bacterium]|nr:quinone-dependent dihydroorotate dehydrogenase [Candidatus Dojkabacteria bacterium]MDQ7020733.1 quinone-dependent dihydroorotate dehydrogenase [Candidatus Dojkabacteria bacterium]
MIKFLYKKALKPIFFRKDPEDVHDRMLIVGAFLGRFKLTRTILRLVFRYDNKMLEQEIDGIKYTNPAGLSAGFDKDANLIDTLYHVGFGFMQVGSVTLNPYEGNPKPRLYRLKKSEGLVVYYGLKNIGVDKIIEKVKKLKKNNNFPISFSIAKTNSTESSTVEGGIEDYYQCMEKLVSADLGDFYTINISCPNAYGGEPYTTPDRLDKLLSKLSEIKTDKPRYVKMPLNLPLTDFNDLLKIIIKFKFEGVIIANLNKDRNSNEIKDEIPENIQGGIGGRPTFSLSNELIKQTYKLYGSTLTVIGVGGIFSAEDAYTKIKLGASLVQLITGMIYEGPSLIKEINKGLVRLMKADGFDHITEAIGYSVIKDDE